MSKSIVSSLCVISWIVQQGGVEMQTVTQSAVLCKSIFKSTSVEELSKEFNKKWIELINRLEQLKCSSELRQK